MTSLEEQTAGDLLVVVNCCDVFQIEPRLRVYALYLFFLSFVLTVLADH